MKFNLLYSYQTNNKFYSSIVKIKSLIFQYRDKFNTEYQKIYENFNVYNDNKIKNLLRYFEKYYTIKTNNECFVKEEYQLHIRLLEKMHMTINVAEAYNNAFSSDLNYTKVSLFPFIECLKSRHPFIEEEVVLALENLLKVYNIRK